MHGPGNPLIVDLVRGPRTESSHIVHAVVVDTGGVIVHAWGDPERPTHPRSAVKPIQALPLVETGAADAFDVTEVELALACASHKGEPGHVTAIDAWLERIGCSPTDLECGVPIGRGDSPVANTCSGKHAGFLTVARHLGLDTAGYIQPDHPVQQLVTAAQSETAGIGIDPAAAGIDGCGIPVHPLPLQAIATAAARFGSPPDSWAPDRRDAARLLAAAMVAEPWFVAGTDRLCTDLLADAGGDVLVKFGAEGVQFAALPRLGLGIALKVVDGARRASEVALGHVLAHLEGRDRTDVFTSRRRVTNHMGTHVADLIVR